MNSMIFTLYQSQETKLLKISRRIIVAIWQSSEDSFLS